MKKKILCVRPDRIGDVVLTIPAVQFLRKKLPQVHLNMLVAEELAPVLEGVSFLDQLHVVSKKKSSKQWEAFFQTFDAVLFFHIAPFLLKASFWAQVPIRLGPVHQWDAWFFLTHPVFQKRSQVKKHESKYNMDLVQRFFPLWKGWEIGKDVKYSFHEIELYAPCENEKKEVKDFFYSKKIPAFSKKILLHPGMGGSAKNWKKDFYIELIFHLLKKNPHLYLFLSFGPKDQAMRDFFKKRIAYHKEEKRQKGSKGQKGREEKDSMLSRLIWLPQGGVQKLISVLKEMDLVIAPSTGVLHLASSLGIPVVSIYPPIRVQSVQRWGPLGKKNHAWVPDVPCLEPFFCKKKQCPYYDCMERVSVLQVAQSVQKWI